eukprot:scaffold176038_cov38-Tisochrysis_lutea.AAC.2
MERREARCCGQVLTQIEGTRTHLHIRAYTLSSGKMETRCNALRIRLQVARTASLPQVGRWLAVFAAQYTAANAAEKDIRS